MPFERSSRPVISITNDCRAGRSNVLTQPWTSASARIIHGWTKPVLTASAISVACRSISDWVTSSSRRLSTRSAMTPAHSASGRTG